MPETRKPQMNKDLPGTLTTLVFTGKVRLASKGRALTIEVLKTSQLIMATKSQLHITLAYHADQTFPEHIVKTTEKWINNLSISQRTVSLRRRWKKSDIIQGSFKEEYDFRQQNGLLLTRPLHIELYAERKRSHGKYGIPPETTQTATPRCAKHSIGKDMAQNEEMHDSRKYDPYWYMKKDGNLWSLYERTECESATCKSVEAYKEN